MNKIGLTGNIASGKSEVEKIISNLGFEVIDLDKIVHNLYEDNAIKEELLKTFSTSNRKEIAQIVFKDKNKLKKLEEIIHPILKNFIINLDDTKVTFVSGALLFEAHFDKLFDKIIFVDAPLDLRLKRLMKRNNLSKNEALVRITSQNSNYIKNADYIIENDSNLEELKQKVTDLLPKILK